MHTATVFLAVIIGVFLYLLAASGIAKRLRDNAGDPTRTPDGYYRGKVINMNSKKVS